MAVPKITQNSAVAERQV